MQENSFCEYPSSNMKKGMGINMNREIPGYQLLYKETLSDVAGTGMIFQHIQSGARICVIQNEDVQKVFQIAFRTVPTDNTGAAHIVEHAVFCGSEKFPVKDVFAECEKGSVKTFLNAITYSDKTVYPVASCNEKDFYNLVDLYLDSVFHPLLLQKEEIFRQEGWRYELEDISAPITLNGIVYNEMQGIYASPDAVLYSESEKTLYAGSSYGFDAGGNCEEIPKLSYEDCLDFYKKHYHPSNSYIYFYGNLDFSELLLWLDREYLCGYERQEPCSDLHTVPVRGGLQKKEIPFSAEEEEAKSAYLLQILTGSPLDVMTCTALDVLAEVLVEASGAPVKQALLEAGIGRSVSGEYNCETLQPSFSIEVQDGESGKSEQFFQVIQETLKHLVQEGLDKNSLLATINSQEFALREAEYENPKGVEYGILMLNSWLYDDRQAFSWLQRLEIYSKLRELVKTDYFECLIAENLLTICRGVLAELIPTEGLLEKRQTALEKKLSDYKKSLSNVQLEELIRANKQLQAYQEQPDSTASLAKMPRLTLADISRQGSPLYNKEIMVSDRKLIWHSIPSNGIIYLKCHFPLPAFTGEELHILGLVITVLGGLHTHTYTYGELSVFARMYTGGLSFYAETFASEKGTEVYTPMLAAEIRVLEGNLARGLDLLEEILLHSKFRDKKRLKELVGQALSQMKNDILCDSGYYARRRALSYYAVQEQFMEQINGLSFYAYLKDLAANFDIRFDNLVIRMEQVLQRILGEKNCIFDLTTEQKGMEEAVSCIPAFVEKLREKENIAVHGEDGIDMQKAFTGSEAFILPGTIQHTALCGSFASAGYSFSGVLDVVKNLLNTDYLYQEVRMKGGAYGYGCRLYTVSGHMIFFSDDDPNLEETFAVYEHAADYLEQLSLTEEELEKYIIGTIGQEDFPLGARQMGEQSFNGYMNGFGTEKIQKEREEILSATLEQIHQTGTLLRAVTAQGYCCVIGGEKKIKKEGKRFAQIKKLKL